MDADELYGLPLERFVPERTALAKALRADGRRDEAAQVAALRKPSVAAWAVNQLVRTQGRALTELFEAGDALRAAHEAAVSGGGDGRALRAAGEHERQAIEALVGIARGLLDDQGHELSETMIERVGDTLRAASRDDEAREQVRSGRLERELRQLGLGMSAGAEAPAAPARRREPRKKATAKPERDDRRGERERTEQRERAAARKAAEAAEAKARKASERAARAVETVQERRDRAAKALAGAEEALAAAREEAEVAAREHRRAKANL